MKKTGARVLTGFLWIFSTPSTASAHGFAETSLDLSTGFFHPLLGVDHMLAMVCVGIWGAQLGKPAIWVLPIAFPLIMAVGGAAGVIGMPLPHTELLIAASVIVLGALIAWIPPVPLWAALALVGLFAIAHGHAHGTELPDSADAIAFSIGFVTATGLLHGVGIAIGFLTEWPTGARLVRIGGSFITLAGCLFAYDYFQT